MNLFKFAIVTHSNPIPMYMSAFEATQKMADNDNNSEKNVNYKVQSNEGDYYQWSKVYNAQ